MGRAQGGQTKTEAVARRGSEADLKLHVDQAERAKGTPMRESYIDFPTRSIVTLSPSLNTPGKWWVNRVSVLPKHRGGSGIASRLLSEACADADREGVILRAYVSPDVSGTGLGFDELRRFYSRYGFDDAGAARGDMTRHPAS